MAAKLTDAKRQRGRGTEERSFRKPGAEGSSPSAGSIESIVCAFCLSFCYKSVTRIVTKHEARTHQYHPPVSEPVVRPLEASLVQKDRPSCGAPISVV